MDARIYMDIELWSEIPMEHSMLSIDKQIFLHMQENSQHYSGGRGANNVLWIQYLLACSYHERERYAESEKLHRSILNEKQKLR